MSKTKHKKHHIWTKEAVLKEAKKYKTRKAWVAANRNSYEKARTAGWLDECTAHMEKLATPAGYWTKERLIKHTKQFTTIAEWAKASPGTYKQAGGLGIVDRCASHMTRLWEPKWDKEKVLKSARKYKTVGDWRQAAAGAYMYAHKSGFLSEATSHMEQLLWKGERVIKRTLMALDIVFTHQHRFVDDPTVKHYPFDFFVPSLNLIIEYHGEQHQAGSRGFRPESDQKAQSKRDQQKAQFAKTNGYDFLEISAWEHRTEVEIMKALLTQLSKYGILREMRQLSKAEERTATAKYQWTLERCKKDAKKYETKAQWRAASAGAYNAAYRQGWTLECTKHMKALQKPTGYWTIERCAKEAKRYETRREFEKGSSSAYQGARRKGWLDQICAHMNCGRIKSWAKDYKNRKQAIVKGIAKKMRRKKKSGD